MTKAELKRLAREHWAMWRLVLDAKMDYNTVFHQMLPSEVEEANAALDMYIAAMKQANKK